MVCISWVPILSLWPYSFMIFIYFLLWFGLKQCNSSVHIYYGGVSLCNLIHMQIAWESEIVTIEWFCVFGRVMRMRWRVWHGIHQVHFWLHAVGINLCGYGRCCQAMSLSASQCSMVIPRMWRWWPGIPLVTFWYQQAMTTQLRLVMVQNHFMLPSPVDFKVIIFDLLGLNPFTVSSLCINHKLSLSEIVGAITFWLARVEVFWIKDLAWLCRYGQRTLMVMTGDASKLWQLLAGLSVSFAVWERRKNCFKDFCL